MATFPITFRSDSSRIHRDHYALRDELLVLEAALDGLGADAGIHTGPLPSTTVRGCCRHLAEVLPGHFRHEETTMLETVAGISPELAEFSRQMRQAHEALRRRLLEFCHAAQELETGYDADASVAAVKQSGKRFVAEMTAHIALEEDQLDGFL